SRIGAASALLRSALMVVLDFVLNILWSILTLMVINAVYPVSDELFDTMESSPEYLFVSSAYNILAIVMVFLFWKYVDHQKTEAIGLKGRTNSLKLFGTGLLLGSLEIVLVILLSLSSGILWFDISGFKMFSTTEILRSLFYGSMAFILVGFGEEAVFRGYIQKRLMFSIGNKGALAISTLLFMAAHVLTYGKPLDFIDVALGGLIMGYLYMLTDSLYLPAAYHFIFDYLQVNIVRLQDYEYYKGAVLYIFSNTGDLTISGVNYGNIVELSFIAAEIVMLLLLYTLRRRISSMGDPGAGAAAI
ncbi:MAG TPA: CPBP family intramembrane glutamic endopeptidase, partial [Negativicutes bacterium]|nr:CPBP family intramembrane glutamic endopeptidase [Negativicutes bacterium]